MIAETYDYSKAKARKRRFREAATAIPGVLLIVFFTALYIKNPVAQQVAEAVVDHCNWLAVFGVCVQARR